MGWKMLRSSGNHRFSHSIYGVFTSKISPTNQSIEGKVHGHIGIINDKWDMYWEFSMMMLGIIG